MLVIDEVHNVVPSATGKYATDSLRTQAIRDIAPHFEHRLFLSATPHNGYEESWTALLELLDPQRFARGVKPMTRSGIRLLFVVSNHSSSKRSPMVRWRGSRHASSPRSRSSSPRPSARRMPTCRSTPG